MSELSKAKDGCNGEVLLADKCVYYEWERGGYTISELGTKMDKKTWINEHIVNTKHEDDIQKMLVDWELYENGWFITGYSNNHLFNYLCQLGSYPEPKALEYIIGYLDVK